MKRVTFMLILFLLALMLGTANEKKGETEAPNPLRLLAEAERIELAKLLYSYEPFLETAVDVNFPETLNHLLDPSIYQKLKGNPFIGYIHDEGIDRINGASVSLEIRSASHTEKYLPVFRQIFRQANPAQATPEPGPAPPFHLTVCLVDVTTRPVPAVTIEAVLRDGRNGRRFCLRASTGYHKGLYEAMELASRRLFLSLDFLGRRP